MRGYDAALCKTSFITCRRYYRRYSLLLSSFFNHQVAFLQLLLNGDESDDDDDDGDGRDAGASEQGEQGRRLLP